MKTYPITPEGGIDGAAWLHSIIFTDPSGQDAPIAESRARLLRHAGYPGFRGFILHTDEGQPVGFAYGYRSSPGQFYRSLLEEHLSGADRAAWLDDCFEFVALGVIPEHRRRGYGRLLHDAVLQRAAERIAILTTEASNSASRALYTGLGWQLLSPGFRPPGAAEPFVIMVKTLKTESVG